MESLNFHNIKSEKANAMIRYKKRQRVTMFFRFIEFCIFFVVISRFSTQLPLNYFKGFDFTLVTPRFVFVLVNAIVIILFFKSNSSTDSIKFDLYDEYTQKYSIYYEQSKKQSIAVKEANCDQQRKQSIVAERRLEKRIHRSHSENTLCLAHDEKKSRKRMNRSATVGCLKNIDTDSVKPAMTTKSYSYPEDGMSNGEFRKTIEAFIARQQRLLKEEEFSSLIS
ncbi:uncharacterized protein LOC107013355 [Solanum pennellii]|uniref:Uncharacterized protein LOC107013355 n=1 Tax=Solanum pennellii TaxID=28526 RepID=A0ABM1GBP4_SOLPN|nr:uncharacterized protein LOC107013355 [Solanum pennellii]